MSAECRSCHAPIVWALTEAGKPMPFDAEPSRDGNYVLLDDTDDEGRPIRRSRYSPSQPTMGLFDPRDHFMPHWATCPRAAQHRTAQE